MMGLVNQSRYITVGMSGNDVRRVDADDTTATPKSVVPATIDDSSNPNLP
jgi:hypothetical protein